MTTSSNRRTIRTPKAVKDHDGRDIVLVPLANAKSPAKLFKESFELLLGLKITTNWNVNAAGHVRFREGTRAGVCLGRLLMEARANQRVTFIDRNPLNLRLDNMLLKKGKGADREWDILRRAKAERDAWAEIERKTEGMEPAQKFFAQLAEIERRRAESPWIEDGDDYWGPQ
jgi:hypothetical protein